jgi:hypothetical protein
MGNAECTLITTDNKAIHLGHAAKAPAVVVQGQCDNDEHVNSCSYLLKDLKNLLNNSGSTTKKIKQIYVGKGTRVIIYDQDNYQGNKYYLFPFDNFVVPPCFTIKSIKQIALKDPNDKKKLKSDQLDSVAVLTMMENFTNINSPNDMYVGNTQNLFIIFILFLIVLYLLYCYKNKKKLFFMNKS